ncbi:MULTISPECIES: ribosomal L7Ae/L30e/S12e/Gadd45 family protein [unclassified Clostridium]|jgi:ribosomal protein L7Ae/L30e/S12e/gadd45|uniref:ribosomal L7Ae/L30e/S12e/Gadd45 family protein n=1 Tax=unclassified Clostridium TaxID=2614128 RepID=UPI0025BFC5FE|nr:ribosomal L7Ae/L30e/S12e/Gadd45 family protein [Clostridium sp.]MCI6692792.1 ribosomal L7Ae/L30e/S12e/Gadd45 family protein [Clostridium sp.]MDY4250931.1 ribosomal L7Ae/L30e/S12e/Gadd45 family protein [Clostridium sp.]MDY6227049.1 ribosomal L7Ae/L30e/S12e/Gadd45 family protein [Clostridium sp.]
MSKFFNFLGLAKRSGSVIEGYSKCDEERNRKNIFLFIISNDASNSTKKKFKNHCLTKNIVFIEDFSKEELGSSIGREEVKILAITDKNMANKLYTLYEEQSTKI